MIVLDDNIGSADLARQIAAWYPGRVAILKDLRVNTTIKDEAVETILRTVSAPTFVTINADDFWKKIRPNIRFAVINIQVEGDHLDEISDMLRKFMRHPEFNTKAKRMGTIALLRPTRIELYRANHNIEMMDW